MAEQDNKVVVILAGVLLAIMVVAGAVFLFLPSGDDSSDEVVTTLINPDAQAPSGTARGFDLTVLRQRAFQLLNRQLVLEGALPVQAPAEIGKANPFL